LNILNEVYSGYLSSYKRIQGQAKAASYRIFSNSLFTTVLSIDGTHIEGAVQCSAVPLNSLNVNGICTKHIRNKNQGKMEENRGYRN
jgi:hypothetical protein